MSGFKSKAELARHWREIVLSYELRARRLREDGDPAHAEEYERVAQDYRRAIERLGEE